MKKEKSFASLTKVFPGWKGRQIPENGPVKQAWEAGPSNTAPVAAPPMNVNVKTGQDQRFAGAEPSLAKEPDTLPSHAPAPAGPSGLQKPYLPALQEYAGLEARLLKVEHDLTEWQAIAAGQQERITHLEHDLAEWQAIAAGQQERITHLEKLVTGQQEEIALQNEVITGQRERITHLEHDLAEWQAVAAGQQERITHLEQLAARQQEQIRQLLATNNAAARMLLAEEFQAMVTGRPEVLPAFPRALRTLAGSIMKNSL
eukprot:jgi/Botrbrau1/6991/Bobra.0165s0023.1